MDLLTQTGYQHKGSAMKLWQLDFYDRGVYCTEYHYGTTRMEARGNVVRRLKRQVKFEVERVVDESEVSA